MIAKEIKRQVTQNFIKNFLAFKTNKYLDLTLRYNA